ncbi:MAG: hypothetical protein V4693_13850 [Pseudomonadota bacterium]
MLLHAALLNSLLRQPRQARPDTPRSTMVWMNIVPAPKPVAPPPVQPPARERQPPAHIAAPVPAPARATAPALVERAPEPITEQMAEPASPTISAEQIMSNAKRDLSAIDKALRKESGKGVLGLSGDSRQQRLSKGIEQAHDMAPNKWYQAAKIEDITPPGDDARKIYRITGVAGSYCVRYPDKNRIGAQTGAANFGAPLIGKCPEMF